MTYTSALSSMDIGTAIKVSSWSGYIKKQESGTVDEWAKDTDYKVNDVVRVNGSYYVCKTDHVSGEMFTSANWKSCQRPYALVLRPRVLPSPSDKYTYTYAPVVEAGLVTYKVTAPNQFPLDSQLFSAFSSSDWETLSLEDAEARCTGDGLIW